MSKTNDSVKPVSLNGTLRDLAIFRASDIDLAAVMPRETTGAPSNNNHNVENSLKRSYEFVREARAVVSMDNRGVVETEGGKVEAVRGSLEDVLKGLGSLK